MTSIAEYYRRGLDATGDIVARISPDQLSLPTPDDDWDVRAVLNHVISGSLWVVELVAGRTIEEVGDRLDGDVVGDDPASTYRRSADAAAEAFEAPGALDAQCAVSYGPVPGSVYAGHMFIDVLIHGWDLAVATGQDTTLDPELVDACLAEVEPQLDFFQAGGGYAEPPPIPVDADPQTRLLAMLGRRDQRSRPA